jgi:radical SAM protein with 4Fe4S-binding SPASM domain
MNSNISQITGEASTQPSTLDSLNYPISPSIYTLELTTRCNNTCTGCANAEMPHLSSTYTSSGGKDMLQWESIIEAIAPYAKVIRISGGEPTLHPNLSKIVNLIEKRKISHALFTTGRWAGKKREEIIELYTSCNHHAGMLISLHGATREAHHSFVQSGEKSFTETCENIKIASKSGIRVFTNTVLTSLACEQIDQIIELSLSLGSQQVVFNRFLAVNHPLLPTNIQLRTALEKIQMLKQFGIACRIGNNVPPCFLPNALEVAKAGYELCHISPDGSLRPDNLSLIKFGNILKNNPEELWNSAPANIYRQSVSEDCKNCGAFNQCRGGAKSLQWANNLETDPLMQGPLESFINPGNGDPKDDVFSALTSD